MSRRSIETIQREARTNDQVKICPSATRRYSVRYSNRIGVVVRKSTTDRKTNQKICAVRFPNRASELLIDVNDLVVVHTKS